MVSSVYAPLKQAGNGVATAFSGLWKILAATDLLVYVIDASGNQGALLVNGTDYTVVFDPIAETFTVTYTVAPVNGGFSLIDRQSDNHQQTSLPREGPLPAKVVETMIDKLQLQIQEVAANASPAPVTYATGAFSARPAAGYAVLTYYISTDRNSVDLWVPPLNKYITIG